MPLYFRFYVVHDIKAHMEGKWTKPAFDIDFKKMTE
jgi:hypothetical protein